MGHVFASKESPEHTDEFEFLGWEMAVVKRIGLPWAAWRAGTKDYSLGLESSRPRTIGELSDKQTQALFDERLAHARKRGLVDDDDRPRSLREKMRSQ